MFRGNEVPFIAAVIIIDFETTVARAIALFLCRLQVSNKSTIYMHDLNRGLHLHEIHVGVFGENFLSREII